MNLTLKTGYMKEVNPEVIVQEHRVTCSEPKYVATTITGTWARVFPQTASDVFFLQCLEHRVDKFAPANGVGVIVSASALGIRL